MGIAEYGDPEGWPVLYFHGFPGSRLEAQFLDGAATELHARVLAWDRPGYGRSDSKTRGSSCSLADDILAVTEACRLSVFSILAVSGGVPHALAVASGLPGMIANVALVCGFESLRNHAATVGMNRSRRIACCLLRGAPWLIPVVGRFLQRGLARDPAAALKDLEERVPPIDRAALQDTQLRGAICASFAEALRSGSAGIAADLRSYLCAPPMDPRGMQMPVSIWHGQRDTIVPARASTELAGKLPHSRLILLPEEGHYSLPLRHHRAILEGLIRAQRG